MSNEENPLEFNSTIDDETLQLNNRVRNDFMSYCYSFLNDNQEAHQCVDTIWKKYLDCIGDAPMLAAFFDALPHHIKTSILPKYQTDLFQWFEKLFHFQFDAIHYSSSYIETFQRLIRYVSKQNPYKKGVIYIPMNFDSNLKFDLLSTIKNIKFEHVPNNSIHDDMINIDKLNEFIQRDSNQTQIYPLMVIANVGSSLFGHCDELTKLKHLCEQKQIWLHAIGDLFGSLALLEIENIHIQLSCDSLTMDTMKLFAIKTLPYLTFYLRTNIIHENTSTITSHSLYEFILQNSSIDFVCFWSLMQHCQYETIVQHMKQSFDLTQLLHQRLEHISTINIMNQNQNHDINTYQRICFNENVNEILPKSIVIFRFQSTLNNTNEFYSYIDILNLWLFDKLSQQYSKMNLELLKSIHFQLNNENSLPTHAIRFAPLEHSIDSIQLNIMETFCDDIQYYCEIIQATLIAHYDLDSILTKYDNLVSIHLANWPGIGAIRYIPQTVDSSNLNEISAYEINAIQVELARYLKTNDTAFSLGNDIDEHESIFYLRLGMIRKSDDLQILLEKIVKHGQEIEQSFKYMDDMGEKIKNGIQRAQKDLYNENLNLLAQDGILRQLPVVSNILSWWSPAPSSAPLAVKGRSFDLNSGEIESTEDTYVYRMQIKKQPIQNHLPTEQIEENSKTKQTCDA